jgi:integrase
MAQILVGTAQALHRFSFTDARLAALEHPKAGRAWFYDDLPGLSLMLTAAGQASFYLTGSFQGKGVRLRLGIWPTLKTDDARRACKALAGQLASGVDVLARRRQERLERAKALTAKRAAIKPAPRPTWESVWTIWQTERGAYLRPKTLQVYTSYWHQGLVSWENRCMDSITQADAAARHAELGRDHGKVTANRIRTLAHLLHRFATTRCGLDTPSPWLAVRPFEEQARARCLTDIELGRLLAAIHVEHQPMRDVLLLMMATGCRAGNARGAMWADMDLAAACWRIPGWRIKGRKGITIPLPPTTVAMLTARRVMNPQGVYVFTGPDGNAIGESLVREAWKRCCERASIVGAWLHDIRRSIASSMVAQGASIALVSRVLGHASTAITEARYIRLGAEDVRVHVNALAARLAAYPLRPDTAPAVPASSPAPESAATAG